MKISPCFLVLAATFAVSSFGQIIDTPDGVVAGIPANYTEAKTGAYTLPDPLRFANGEAVKDAEVWATRRRPEIFRMLEENQFGRAPGRPEKMTFDVFDKGTPTFDGQALRKQVTIYFSDDRTKNYVDVLLYLPAQAEGPAPVLLMFGWSANNLAVNDPGVKPGRAWDPKSKTRVEAKEGMRRIGRTLDVAQFVQRGFAVATFNYSDIDPDAPDAIAQGVRSLYLKSGDTTFPADEWGSIAAWSWGASRIIDYLETDPQIDAKRIAITGASRLGKTALWTAACDQRIACVIASVSGEGGAALSRRNYGETVAHLVAPTRYAYQFAGNYQKWANRANEAPFDSHFLLALIAPRPLLLQTGNTDKWSDPYGEFLAAKAATSVYELLGKKGIEEYSLPAPGKPLLNTVGYLMHEGGHGVMPADWPVFLDFLEKYLK
ncbi:MAG TPA: acetylxylan esterase [Opitutaceae bacterium]|nr:acetylxylan esterase [Opitutaceae bacterium]